MNSFQAALSDVDPSPSPQPSPAGSPRTKRKLAHTVSLPTQSLDHYLRMHQLSRLTEEDETQPMVT